MARPERTIGPVTSRLRKLIAGTDTAFLMEAHNPLSAKTAENAGFEALWASSLTISAAMGLRDANELTWSQTLDIVSAMIDGVDIPVLVDADSGYGDFNITGRFVRQASKAGVAGVCIEDKLFPKLNSFAPTEQALADIGDFTGKIMAAKDSQTCRDFMVVARTEAFITGASLDEALTRAHAYVSAGADAVLVQSKKSDADEILAFAEAWQATAPLIVVPTTYADTPTEILEAAGVSAVIWANQSLRASIHAMEALTRRVFATRSVAGLEAEIASIADIFRLTDMDALMDAAKRYKPKD